MYEINKKDTLKFRELPLRVVVGTTYYYDFTLMDRYVVFHSMSGVYARYQMFDKVSRIQHRILDSKIRFCDKNYSLLVPYMIYAVQHELGHPWGMRFKGEISKEDHVDILFRGVMPQLGFTVREDQIKMAKTMLAGLIKKKITLYEAGVGTGKTMSYLAAAYLATRMDTTYQYTQNPITIATSSIDLQR